jgi:Domain of unknown function (DUF927)
MSTRNEKAASGRSASTGQRGQAANKNSRKKPKKLGFKIVVTLPIAGNSRQADIMILNADGSKATMDRGDLGDSRERSRLARKLARRLEGEPDQWENALEQAHLEAFHKREANLKADQDRLRHPKNHENHEFGYRVVNGRICSMRAYSGEEALVALCNFNAWITEEVCLDDGSGETALNFTIEGALAHGTPLPPVTVKAADFPGMHWPLIAWGHKAIIAPGQGTKDHLRAAIQFLSTATVSRTIYAHTGWRQIGPHWVYLHAGGAITAAGVELGVSVKLDGPLARFDLPAPPVGDHLKEAVRASLRLLRLSVRLMAPILGVVYRSVLGPADCSLHLVGHTGRGKSELLALGQQHHGASMHRLNLPGNWLSTGNSLESMAFHAKDASLVIDDFKPGGAKSDIDRLHQLADRVFRAQGNWSGRGRCRADGSLRVPRPPRGMILSSGEDVPRGESLRARLFVLHVEQGEIDVKALTPYQQDGASGRYAAAMAGYLSWLAARYDQVCGDLAWERAALRDKALSASGHARTPGIVADLAVGWKYFLAFATETGAVTPAERDQFVVDVWSALLAGAAEQEAELATQDPANRFLSLLAAAIASGRGHFANYNGDEPDADPEAWGWQRRNGENQTTAWTSLGKQLGWVRGDDLFLDPETAYAETQRFGEEQGERLPLSQRQLHKRLNERGLLASTEAGRLTCHRILQGRERVVLHLRTASLIPQKSWFSGFSGSSAPASSSQTPDSFSETSQKAKSSEPLASIAPKTTKTTNSESDVLEF